MRIVEITREPVELFKILKFESMANSGGQAKLLIDDGMVSVNGEVETRKRRKIVHGDVIELFDEAIQIEFVAATEAPTTKASAAAKPKKTKPAPVKKRQLLKPFKH